MELSILALKAVEISLWALDKASGGALEKAGGDVLSFLADKFQGRLQIQGSNSTLLEAAILSEAEQDKKFQEDLDRLVTQFHQIQNINNVSQTTSSGVNMNVPNNSGTAIGQQTINNVNNDFFR